MGNIDFLFPTMVYSDTILNFEQKNTYLKNKALELKQQHQSCNSTTHWYCDTFNTLGIYDGWQQDSIMQELIQITGNHVLHFAEQYGVKNKTLVCREFWFNVSSPGSYQEFHQHSGHHFSLSYYLQAPKNSGNILFRSMESYTDMFPLPIENNNYNMNSFKTYGYEPKESKFLIFRSNLPHMVEKNMSNENRISVAMNFRFE